MINENEVKAGLMGVIVVVALVILFVLSLTACVKQTVAIDAVQCPNPHIVVGKLTCDSTSGVTE